MTRVAPLTAQGPLARLLRISQTTLCRKKAAGLILDNAPSLNTWRLHWDLDEVQLWAAEGFPKAAFWRQLRADVMKRAARKAAR